MIKCFQQSKIISFSTRARNDGKYEQINDHLRNTKHKTILQSQNDNIYCIEDEIAYCWGKRKQVIVNEGQIKQIITNDQSYILTINGQIVINKQIQPNLICKNLFQFKTNIIGLTNDGKLINIDKNLTIHDNIQQLVCSQEFMGFIKENELFIIGQWQFDKYYKLSSKVYSLTCGQDHVMIIDEYMQLYGFGKNSQGQLGIGHNNDEKSPIPIENEIHQVWCGWESTIIKQNDKYLISGKLNYCNHYQLMDFDEILLDLILVWSNTYEILYITYVTYEQQLFNLIQDKLDLFEYSDEDLLTGIEKENIFTRLKKHKPKVIKKLKFVQE
ncbi:hypothetical protein pb186bvf_010445 [Paramecium bursaria]